MDVTAATTQTADTLRERLLEGIPLEEHTYRAGGIRTAVLEGGDGPPIVILHGPGESGVSCRRIAPDLVRTNRVIAPDLPAHGRTEAGPSTPADVVDWLGDLIDRTCETPPVLIGQVIGGAIGARFALEHGDQLRHLVIVDSVGLARFRPKPGFAATFFGFVARPTDRSFTRFMGHCSHDLDLLRRQMGDDWDPFVSYNVALTKGPNAKAAGKLFRQVGIPRIPPEDLARIEVPTTLIWGRHDRALNLKIAETASERYGWGLHVIEDCADDPPRDKPTEFLAALRTAIDQEGVSR